MKSVNILITIFLIFQGFFVLAQETNLYDSQGRLKIDTCYHIERNNLEHVRYFEGSALQGVYGSVEYPRLAYQNGIYGLVIAKIKIMKGNLDTYCEIVKSPDPILSKAIKDAFLKNALNLIRTSKTEDIIEFFVPFEFELNEYNFIKGLNKNKLIKIRKSYFKPIMSW